MKVMPINLISTVLPTNAAYLVLKWQRKGSGNSQWSYPTEQREREREAGEREKPTDAHMPGPRTL